MNNAPPRPDLDELIRVGWAAGLSTAAIGRTAGVTKNVIVGRARRLKLTPRPSPLPAHSTTRILRKGCTADGAPVVKKTPVPRVAVAPRPAVPVSRSAALTRWVVIAPPVHEPGRGCLFPMWGDRGPIPRPALYCGNVRHGPGKMYCTGHQGISYTAYKPSEKPAYLERG